MEEYKKMLRNYAQFAGRSTRRDYWMAVFVNIIISIAVGIVAGIIHLPALAALYEVAMIIPILALGWRRFHDTNRSGLCIFISLIPVIGWIIELVFLCQTSVDENNKYGDIVE